MDLQALAAQFSPPRIKMREAHKALARHFATEGELSCLGGERDQNFLLTAGNGQKYVLKISNATESEAAVDLQCKLLSHIAETAPEIGTPRTVRNLQGTFYVRHQFDGVGRYFVRLVSYVEGESLARPEALTLRTAFEMGALQARVCRVLANFFHPAARRPMPWDSSSGLMFCDDLANLLAPEIAEQLDGHKERLEIHSLPALRSQRAQVIHSDVHTGNIMLDAGGKIRGLIDFGDAIFGPLLLDLAASATSIADTCPADAGALISELERGFDSVFPLLPEESALLLDATILRSMLCVQLARFKSDLAPDSAERSQVHAASEKGLLALLSLASRKDRGKQRQAPVPADSGKQADGSEEILRRRRKALSPTYKLFYEEPLQIVRGSGAMVFDADGREYLDCYNNVPSVGHCNPHVVSALKRQAERLNTHTRYLHEEIVRYAERLTATLPEELDTCLFCCTGTEANDLAYQIACGVTGKRGAVVSQGAYHGNSVAVGELSPDDGDPVAIAEHVCTIPVPDTYRGAHGPDETGVGRKFAELAREAIERMARSSFGLSMLMVDPIFDAPGIFTAPDAYLKELFSLVRGLGGVIVVDEVQSGLCRLGDNTWGFEDSAVVPDIVTMGKPMGNGHPLAAVVGKRQILEKFAVRHSYFNTYGGNPVSAAVGNAVLDVIADEEILKNVHAVGQHLTSGLERLQQKHAVIGDLRGKGFFRGIDLVTDRQKRTPAPRAAHAVVNKLRHDGVLVSVNGSHDNVIKIRPPLVFSEENADQLVEALDDALSKL